MSQYERQAKFHVSGSYCPRQKHDNFLAVLLQDGDFFFLSFFFLLFICCLFTCFVFFFAGSEVK